MYFNIKLIKVSVCAIPIFLCDVSSMVKSQHIKDGHGNDTVGGGGKDPIHHVTTVHRWSWFLCFNTPPFPKDISLSLTWRPWRWPGPGWFPAWTAGWCSLDPGANSAINIDDIKTCCSLTTQFKMIFDDSDLAPRFDCLLLEWAASCSAKITPWLATWAKRKVLIVIYSYFSYSEAWIWGWFLPIALTWQCLHSRCSSCCQGDAAWPVCGSSALVHLYESPGCLSAYTAPSPLPRSPWRYAPLNWKRES